MKFPMLNISKTFWNKDEDFLIYYLFDEYIHTNDERVFYDFFYLNRFIDCNGELFEVFDRVLPKSIWRRVLKFLPNIYKVKLKFRKINTTMDIERLKKFLMERVESISTGDKFWIEWINQIKNGKTYCELIDGQIDE